MKALLVLLLLTSVASAETLPNGLKVVVDPDPTVNSIVVYVRYGGGYTEDANTVLLDRLFADPAQDDRLDAIGGYAVSNYEAHHMEVFEVVPAGALELALWAEAKRMAQFDVTQAQLDAAKTSVLADFVDPVDVAIDKALWSGRGERRLSGKQLEAVTLEQIRALAQTRLVAANATLVIAGRVDKTATVAMVHHYFDAVPHGEPVRLAKERKSELKHTDVDLDPESTGLYVWALRGRLAVALVLVQVLAKEDVPAEVRAREELRYTSSLPMGLSVDIAATAGDLQVEAARMAAEAKWLRELESLPHRARLLAAGVNIDKVRKQISAVTSEDIEQLTHEVRQSAVRITVSQ